MKTNAITLFILLSLLLGTSACQQPHSPPQKEETQVSTNDSEVTLNTDMIRQIGLKSIPATLRKTSSRIDTVAQIKADENQVFHINSYVSGRISQDRVNLGDMIHSGQTLAVVQNVDVARVQAESIHQIHQNVIDIEQARIRVKLADKNMAREKRLLAEGIAPYKDYLTAESESEMAHSNLRGQKEHETHLQNETTALLKVYGISYRGAASERIQTGVPILSPRKGLVVKKNITRGDMVSPTDIMYEVSDLSRVWLDITIYPKDLNSVRIGMPIAFTSDSMPGKAVHGKIDYIQPDAQNSNTYIARAFLDNPGYVLKPGMFGQVTLESQSVQEKIYIPNSAVQRIGQDSYVFLQETDNRFRKQLVHLGESVNDGFLVNDGLAPGNRIVTEGSFALKSQLLKDQNAGD
jgi:cobalt-zinc-cadmium efflux system membrane fusion protein